MGMHRTHTPIALYSLRVPWGNWWKLRGFQNWKHNGDTVWSTAKCLLSIVPFPKRPVNTYPRDCQESLSKINFVSLCSNWAFSHLVTSECRPHFNCHRTTRATAHRRGVKGATWGTLQVAKQTASYNMVSVLLFHETISSKVYQFIVLQLSLQWSMCFPATACDISSLSCRLPSFFISSSFSSMPHFGAPDKNVDEGIQTVKVTRQGKCYCCNCCPQKRLAPFRGAWESSHVLGNWLDKVQSCKTHKFFGLED